MPIILFSHISNSNIEERTTNHFPILSEIQTILVPTLRFIVAVHSLFHQFDEDLTGIRDVYVTPKAETAANAHSHPILKSYPRELWHLHATLVDRAPSSTVDGWKKYNGGSRRVVDAG